MTYSPERPLRVAIVGAGPSGFFAADSLVKQVDVPVAVDLFDRLPTPFGLVRYGVAPDHQKIKSVTRLYQKTLDDPRVRFFGHVSYGKDLTLGELRRFYDAILYTVGAPSDRALGIPGGQLVVNPIPAESEIPRAEMIPVVDAALADAAAQGIAAKEVTPFLLDRIYALTEGRSLTANIALVLSNARLAARIAAAGA